MKSKRPINYHAPLQPGGIYHVYNRANSNLDLLFQNPGNYFYFLAKYEEYMGPWVDTIAYCLLPNHFHLLVRIPEEGDLRTLLARLVKWRAYADMALCGVLSEAFRRFFIAYAKAFNRQQDRRGVLFQRDFRRLLVDSPSYFQTALHYIHANPVKHGLCESLEDYPWSSFQRLLDPDENFLRRDLVLKQVGGVRAYCELHREPAPVQA